MPRTWTDAYQTHFQFFFQKPFDIQVFHDDQGASLKLAIHDWARQGFKVYASMGIAAEIEKRERDDVGEVILFADVAEPSIPKIFVNALFFILQRDIPLGTPFAIGFGDTPLRRYNKTALYFTRPFDNSEDFSTVEHGEEEGRVYQAFFITPEEDEFLEERGAEEFEREFWKQFESRLSDDERFALIDKSRTQELAGRLEELAHRSNRALSVGRKSWL